MREHDSLDTRPSLYLRELMAINVGPPPPTFPRDWLTYMADLAGYLAVAAAVGVAVAVVAGVIP